jgi:hypothetical protein
VGALDTEFRRAHAADAIGKGKLREGGGEWETGEESEEENRAEKGARGFF